MPALTHATPSDPLMALVGFKWLMAGAGWHIDLSQLQRDRGYAEQCARRGLASGCDALSERSRRILEALSASAPRDGPEGAAAGRAES